MEIALKSFWNFATNKPTLQRILKNKKMLHREKKMCQ